jgi:purine catabolism regulator
MDARTRFEESWVRPMEVHPGRGERGTGPAFAGRALLMHNLRVPVSVPDLLAEPALRLRALSSHCHDAGRRIGWVSTTELPDPMPFLRGDELVMTTGMLPRDDAEWIRLLSRLAELPVAAVCFGTGLVHQEVPSVIVER